MSRVAKILEKTKSVSETNYEAKARKWAKSLANAVDSARNLKEVNLEVEAWLADLESSFPDLSLESMDDLKEAIKTRVVDALADEFGIAQEIESALMSSEEEEPEDDDADEAKTPQIPALKGSTPLGVKSNEKNFNMNIDRAIKSSQQVWDDVVASMTDWNSVDGHGKDKTPYFDISSPQSLKRLQRIKEMLKGIMSLVEEGEEASIRLGKFKSSNIP